MCPAHDTSHAKQQMAVTLGKDWCNTSDYQLAKPKLSCCCYPNISWLWCHFVKRSRPGTVCQGKQAAQNCCFVWNHILCMTRTIWIHEMFCLDPVWNTCLWGLFKVWRCWSLTSQCFSRLAGRTAMDVAGLVFAPSFIIQGLNGYPEECDKHVRSSIAEKIWVSIWRWNSRLQNFLLNGLSFQVSLLCRWRGQ